MQINIVLTESQLKSAVMSYLQELYGNEMPDLPIDNITIEKDPDSDEK